MEKILTKDQILGIQDIKIEKLQPTDWGGKVFVKTLSAEEKDELDASAMDSSIGTDA